MLTMLTSVTHGSMTQLVAFTDLTVACAVTGWAVTGAVASVVAELDPCTGAGTSLPQVRQNCAMSRNRPAHDENAAY